MGWRKKRATASARHILVASKEQCGQIKTDIEDGADFAELAKQHSSCSSAQKGGDLGQFKEHQMAKAFNDVVFSAELHKVHGPVKTQFGYHLIEITERTKN